MDEKRITISGYITVPREKIVISEMIDQGYKHIVTHSINYDDGEKDVTLVFVKK
mgnify:CR=1 FL=1